LDQRARLGSVIADRLVALGLAEKEEATESYVGLGYQEGYQLAGLGWAMLGRGRFPRTC
jgi:hypothetical protein